MNATSMVRAGALLCGLAVGLGAFAAHAMKAHYDTAALQTFETGVRYQIYHGLGLVLCGLLAERGWRLRGAGCCLLGGVVLFSGSLYGLVLGGWKWLGPVTPIGGVLFLVGWLLMLLAGSNGKAKAG